MTINTPIITHNYPYINPGPNGDPLYIANPAELRLCDAKGCVRMFEEALTLTLTLALTLAPPSLPNNDLRKDSV